MDEKIRNTENENGRAAINRPAKASLFYIGSNLLLKGAAFLLTVFFTRALNSEEYGLYPLFLSWEGILTLLAMPMICGGILLREVQKFEREKESFLLSAAVLMMGTTAGAFLLFLLFSEQITAFSRLPFALWLLLFASVFSNIWISLASAEAKFLYKPVYPVVFSLLSGIAAPLAALLLIRYAGIRAEARIFTATGAALLFALPIFWKILRAAIRGKARVSAEILRDLFRSGLPMLPHSLAFLLIGSSDKILIRRFCEAGDVGKYALAFSCAMAISSLCAGVISALGPWVMRRIEKGEYGRIRSVLRTAKSILLPFLLLFLCAIPELFRIAAPGGYDEALGAIYPLTAAVFPLFLCNLFAQAATCYERPLVFSLPSLIGALISLSGNFLLLPRFGFFPAAVVCFAVYSAASGGYAILLKRQSGEAWIGGWDLLRDLLLLGSGAGGLWLLRESLLARILFAAGLLCILLPRAKSAAALIREPRREALPKKPVFG